MLSILNHLKKFDWLLMAAVFILCAISLLTLRGIDLGGGSNHFWRQLIFLLISLGGMVIVSFLEARVLKDKPAVLVGLYFFVVLVLVGVLLSGSKIRGSISWFSVGSLNFEPVELAKLAV
ncbi:MAG: Rod shape-determining protein RodA, partial [Parcubacteria group bacterium GW2011_GWC2_42_6]